MGAAYEKADRSLFGEIVHADMKKAAETTRESYEKAIIKRTKHAEEIHELFESIDALITPMFPRMTPWPRLSSLIYRGTSRQVPFWRDRPCGHEKGR